MRFINIFWNGQERRLRALWRLILQGIIFNLLASITTSAVMLLLFISGGNGLSRMLSNAQLYEQLLDMLANDPLSALLLGIASLVSIFLSIWFAGRFFDRRRLADFGLHVKRSWWIDFCFGLALGALLMSLIFMGEWAAGWVEVRRNPISAGLGIGLLVNILRFIMVGFQEEFFSRGYQITNLAEGLNLPNVGRKWAVLGAFFLTSVFFSLLHLGNPNASAVSTINLVLAGLMLALPFLLTGELALSIGLHITWNFFQGCVFGFPVSGLALDSSLVALTQKGPAAWTGERFGPEAGLIGLAAMLLGSLLIAGWVRWRRGSLQISQTLGVYRPLKPIPGAIPVNRENPAPDEPSPLAER